MNLHVRCKLFTLRFLCCIYVLCSGLTAGLDSRAAQVVVRSIKRVAASGRSIVCTIHQPSIYIFNSFDSLLLLRRGGQTVFYGELGSNSEYLVSYFQGAPSVKPIVEHQNPATWMLEVIGAGTSSSSLSVTDFHAYYKHSPLCEVNTARVNALCTDNSASKENTKEIQSCGFRQVASALTGDSDAVPHYKYCATTFEQAKQVMRRATMSYWRSPSYNFVRMAISVIIAVLFSSLYVNQEYTTDMDVISRCAVMYCTVLFCGVVAMMTVQPVMFSERPAFYREQHSEIYDVALYSMATGLIEIPYLLCSSLFFVLPFFFIVGFDKDGVAEKFMWYWLFQAIYMAVLVYIGQLMAVWLPNEGIAQVIAGMVSTILSLFCGFMIKASDMPSFWTFLYWLNPLHYALEGLIVTQFRGDDTMITTIQGTTMTAEQFVAAFYPDWSYAHRWNDAIGLLLFIVILRFATYLCHRYLRHQSN